MEDIRILSFDPGLNCLGWAMSLYNPEVGILNVQKFGGIKANKIAGKQKELSDIYGSRILALREVEQGVSKLVRSFDPDYVCSEDTFFFSKSPTAYTALFMVVHVIERTLFEEYETFHKSKMTARTLYKFSPRSIKNTASSNSLSTKSEMLKSLAANSEIVFKLKETETIDMIYNQLTEHSVDAISCGFTFAKQALPGILCG